MTSWPTFPVFPHGVHKAGLTHGVIALASPGKVGGGGRDAFIRQRARILFNEKQHKWCSLVHNGAMNTKPFPPLHTKSIRLTIPVDPETHAAFQRLGQASNTSTGRAMGSWLRDTVQAAEYLASTMEKAKEAPQLVAQQLHAYAMGLADETSEVLRRVQAVAVEGTRLRGAAAATDAPFPPSCNTGGKVPKNTNITKTGKTRFPLPPATYQAYADTNGVPPKAPK
jgi:hypothetical protein